MENKEFQETEADPEPKIYTNSKEMYQPEGIHDNFEDLYASPKEPKSKDRYRYINANGDQIGIYNARTPERASKKILRQIYKKTGIPNPIYKIYNEDSRTLYKYAGLVEKKTKADLKKKCQAEKDFLKKTKIPTLHKYRVLQIEYKRY